MIKVNLISDHNVRTHRVSVNPAVSSIGLVYVVSLALTIALLVGFWYTLNRQISSLTASKDQLQAENLKLQEQRRKLLQFEKMKKERQTRIEVIEKLKEFQTGPVLLLNHVIRSIPQDSQLWLTGLDQKGERVNIAGYAARSEVLPDFMVNLSSDPIFKSVELELVQEEREAARFSLVCMTANKPQQAE
jgi:Tfp pilus assembly protein PilN